MTPSGFTRRRCLAVLAAAVVWPRRAAAQAAAATDLMPAFWASYDAAGGTIEQRGRALIDSFFMPRIEAYRAAGIGRVDFVRWLERFDPVAGAVRRLSAALPAAWVAHAARFRAALPDAAEAPVTILPSFHYFDARVRADSGRAALFLGPDTIVAVHGADPDIGILLDHESFHLYHHQVNPTLILPGGDPLWLGIWKEGLAVYASGVLNPDASRLRVLLGDAALAAIDQALLARIARELPPVLGATDGATRARYLGYGYRGDIPARSGYALGLLIAERAAAGRDLAALARLPATEAETLVRREIAALAR
jgi:hypothetical protein